MSIESAIKRKSFNEGVWFAAEILISEYNDFDSALNIVQQSGMKKPEALRILRSTEYLEDEMIKIVRELE